MRAHTNPTIPFQLCICLTKQQITDHPRDSLDHVHPRLCSCGRAICFYTFKTSYSLVPPSARRRARCNVFLISILSALLWPPGPGLLPYADAVSRNGQLYSPAPIVLGNRVTISYWLPAERPVRGASFLGIPRTAEFQPAGWSRCVQSSSIATLCPI